VLASTFLTILCSTLARISFSTSALLYLTHES
jgi:hypothetical protein